MTKLFWFLSVLFLFVGCKKSISGNPSPPSLTTKNSSTYYVDGQSGNDNNSGRSPENAWKTLKKASSIQYVSGDSLLLKRGTIFYGSLNLRAAGQSGAPVIVGAYPLNDTLAPLPLIKSTGYLAGIQVINGKYLEVGYLEISSNGGKAIEEAAKNKRYGVLIMANNGYASNQITLKSLFIHHIFASEQVPSNGQNPTSNLGEGIAVLAKNNARFKGVFIKDCRIQMTGKTGIQLSGSSTHPELFIQNVQIINNHLANIGGPGIQPGKCNNVLVRGNIVDSTGSMVDARMHGRGSGIWPWTCTNVLIEKNAFMHAHGKYDSHGAHIDFNCRNVVIQYNLSMENQGGFVEILGNDHNCAYRYNISINDGSRVKGVDGAKQQGEILLLSGYNGRHRPPKGPYKNYIYNNTIFVKKGITSNFFIAPTTDGLLVANNIFFLMGKTRTVPLNNGRYVSASDLKNVLFKNNLYLSRKTIPSHFPVRNISPIYGNPGFVMPGGLQAGDYIPTNSSLVKGKGILIQKFPGDSIGLTIGLRVNKDFLGNPVFGNPDLGAFEMK